MNVSKVVIPAAGLGTRLLPATKAQPKEMLPLIDKPLVQYAVEEAVASGISDILVVTGRGRGSIEDHFDRAPELELHLSQRGKLDLLRVVEATAELGVLHFLRQKEPLGLGHAVLCAQSHIGKESFAVLLPDEILVASVPGLRQLVERHGPRQGCALSICRVPREHVSHYGIIEGQEEAPGIWRVRNLVEKPSPNEAPSSLAVSGRYLLPSDIFSVLRRVQPGAGSEIQLTDAIRMWINEGQVWAYELEGERYDVGTLAGYLKATVALALRREDLRDTLRAFIEQEVHSPAG